MAIDDDADVIAIVREKLVDAGFQVVGASAAVEERPYALDAAGDGVEALAWIKEEKPDAILLDLTMPCLDGFGFLAELRQDVAR